MLLYSFTAELITPGMVHRGLPSLCTYEAAYDYVCMYETYSSDSGRSARGFLCFFMSIRVTLVDMPLLIRALNSLMIFLCLIYL